MAGKTKLDGWVEKTEKEVGYFKCPFCGILKWTVSRSNDGDVKCSKCDNHYPFEEMEQVILLKKALVCPCSEEIAIADINKTQYGDYMCPNCENILAVEYDTHLLKPEIVLSPEWLENDLDDAECVCDNLYAINCDFNKPYKAFSVIHSYIVQVAGHGFRSFDSTSQKAILFFDKENMEYLGCIIWSKDSKNDMNVLRQIFVFNDKRHHGYGTQMMKFWIEKFGLNEYSTFGIETANESSINILIKLGHVIEENDQIKGVNMLFVNGINRMPP